MKRFYSPAAISAAVLALSALGLGMSAAAEGWHALRPGSEANNVLKPTKDEDRRPAARYLRSLGITDSESKLQPVGDGLQPVFAVRSRANSNMLSTRSMEAPRANLYAIMPRHSLMTQAHQAKLISINSTNLTARNVYYGAQYCQAYGDVDYAYQGSTYKDGILYVPCCVGGLIPTGYVWNEIELSTGRILATHDFGMNSASEVYSLAYNEKVNAFYGLVVYNESHSVLVKVDANTWQLSILGRVGTGDFMASIVYNPVDQRMYAFDENNNVWQVDISDGEKNGRVIDMGSLELDYDLFPFNGGGLVVYSPMDQCYVGIYRDNNQGGHAYVTIDPETLEVIDHGYIKGTEDGFISSIVCVDELADAEAPELPAEAKIEFTDNSLSGKITVAAPTFTYYGIQIPASSEIKTVVKVDGKEIYSKNLKPGESVTFDATLTEGLHKFETICSLGNYDSPARKQNVYIGNDIPEAPSNLNLSGNLLTWSAPGNTGVNLGYVDTKAFTYDVYVDGKKQNSAPISERRYSISTEITQANHRIAVTATANGHTSARAEVDRVFGKSINLPFKVTPTLEESSLFTVLNPTNDAFKWMYTETKTEPKQSGMIYPMSLYEDADDWLILPLLHFDSKDVLYEYSFNVTSVDKYESLEGFDIYLGKTTNYYDFDNLIYSVEDYNVTINPKTFAVNFAVPEPGDYYIALYCHSTKALEGKGMFTYNHSVKALTGQNSAVPANPTDVTAKAAPKAELAIELTLTMPTLDLIGNPLPIDKQIKATATCGDLSAEASALPGAQVTLKCPVESLGYNTVDLVLSNENGEGLHTTYRRYVGIDRPLPPTNIKAVTSEDNMSMTLTWDAPGEVGVNGGYVDPKQLEYDIYLRTSALVYETVGSTKQTSYVFNPETEKMAPYIVGPVAKSPGGISRESLFQRDALGRPMEIPMVEEFNTVSFNYDHNLYRFDTEGEYSGSRWENHNNCASYGLPGCNEVQGALMGFSESGAPCRARILLPKADTKGFNDGVNFQVRYWDYSNCPDIELWGRHSKDQTFKKITTIKANRPITGKWENGIFELPAEFHNNSWVELAIACSFRGNDGEYLVVDNYQIAPLLEHDVKVNPLEITDYVQLGSSLPVRIPVLNAGTERSDVTLRVQLLLPDNKVVEERTMKYTIRAGEIVEKSIRFEINGEYAKFETLRVKAIVEADMDEIPSNNERIVTVNVIPSQLPTVSSLNGEADKDANSASLSWRAPQTSYGNIQDFELETPFLNTESFGDWKNYDIDGGVPCDIGSGQLALNWPGVEQPSAWTVIDPSQTVFKDDSRLQAHTGKHCILARPIYIPDEQAAQVQANDWLISPKLDTSKSQTISFWYNTISGSEKEFIYIWVSFTDDNIDLDKATETQNGSFYRIRPFSKIGEKGWEYVEYDLPAGTQYFALVYSSFAASGVMLDDIKITPSEMKSWDIEYYTLYRNNAEFGEEVVADNITGTSYIDTEYPTEFGGAKYYVRANVRNADGTIIAGPKSNVLDLSFAVSGVSAISTLQGVSGGKGVINFSGLEGHTLSLFTADGKLVKIVKPASDNENVAIESGIYLVVDGSSTAKVIVK